MGTMTNQSNKNNNLIVNKIQNKIILSTLIMQIIVSILVGIFLYSNSKNILIEGTKKQSIFLLQPIQIAAQEMLKTINNVEDKKNYLNIILNLQGEVMFPALKDRISNLKEVYIYSDRKDIHTLKKEPLWIFPKLKKALSRKDASVTFANNLLYVNVPIQIEESPLGGIILEFSADKINQEKRKALLISIILASSTFLLSLILIKLFTKSITKPLQEIIIDLENIANSGELTATTNNYSTLKNSEFKPLITGYLNMKGKIAHQIYQLNSEIAKRTQAEKESTILETSLSETIDEKLDAIKEISIMLKEETSRRTQSEKKLRLNESVITSLLKTNFCESLLIINNKGEIIKINKKLSDDWSLPEEVIINDSEEQLLSYFSYQIINNKKFLEKYQLCEDSNLTLGTFKLKDSRKVLINYFPLKQENKIIGKILTFLFS